MSGNEDDQTDRVRNQGKADGLFRACMDDTLQPHNWTGITYSNSRCWSFIRQMLLAELLGQFYVATAALEKRMDELIKNSDDKKPLLVDKVKKLVYSFTSGYENDLQALLGQ